MKKPIIQSTPGFAEEGQRIYESADGSSFVSRLNESQRAELAEAIAEADRGDVVDADEVFRRLAEKYKIDL